MADIGLDKEVLKTLTTLDAVREWARVDDGDGLRSSVVLALGRPEVPRDLAALTSEDVEAALTGLSVTHPGPPEATTPANPVQKARVRSAIAACRVLGGLRPQGALAPPRHLPLRCQHHRSSASSSVHLSTQRPTPSCSR